MGLRKKGIILQTYLYQCNYSQPRHLRSLRCATLICTIAPAPITDYRSLAALAYLRTDALEVSAYLRKYDAAVSSYRFEVMKTLSYLPCEELHISAGRFI